MSSFLFEDVRPSRPVISRQERERMAYEAARRREEERLLELQAEAELREAALAAIGVMASAGKGIVELTQALHKRIRENSQKKGTEIDYTRETNLMKNAVNEAELIVEQCRQTQEDAESSVLKNALKESFDATEDPGIGMRSQAAAVKTSGMDSSAESAMPSFTPRESPHTAGEKPSFTFSFGDGSSSAPGNTSSLTVGSTPSSGSEEKPSLTEKERSFLNKSFKARIQAVADTTHSMSLKDEACDTLKALPENPDPVKLRALVEFLEKRNRKAQRDYEALMERYRKLDVEYEFLSGEPFNPESGSTPPLLTEALVSYLEDKVTRLRLEKEKDETLRRMTLMLSGLGMDITAIRKDHNEILFDAAGTDSAKGSARCAPGSRKLVISCCAAKDASLSDIRSTRQVVCSSAFGKKIVEAMPKYGLCFSDSQLHDEPESTVQRKDPAGYDEIKKIDEITEDPRLKKDTGIAAAGTLSFGTKASAENRHTKYQERRMYIQ